MKTAAFPNIPFCNTLYNMSWLMKEYQLKKNKFLRTQFTILSVWARWLEKQTLFHEDKLKMNLQSNIQKMQLLRRSSIFNEQRNACSRRFEWYHHYFRRSLAVTQYFQEYYVSFKQALTVIPNFKCIELIPKSCCSHLFNK